MPIRHGRHLFLHLVYILHYDEAIVRRGQALLSVLKALLVSVANISLSFTGQLSYRWHDSLYLL